MKILVLAKRFTSGKDSVKDNFGRVIRLFEQIAEEHDITLIEADHLKKERFEAKIGNLRIKVVPFSLFGLLSYYNFVQKEAKSHDAIYATSHPIFGGMGLMIAKKLDKKFFYDVQDDYRSYTKNPVLLFMSEQAIKKADMVSCASNKLCEKADNANALTIPNGYDPKVARALDKKVSRKKLKLTLNAKIVAYTGSIEFRGPDMLLNAAEKLIAKDKNIHLLFVGSSIKHNLEGKGKKNVTFLHSMPYKELFVVISAADVMVMPYPKNTFTEAMLAPYKLVEYMACGKPIVVSDVGEMQKLAPQFLFKAGDEADMISKIIKALKQEKVDYGKTIQELTWERLGKKLSKKISDIAT